MPVRVTIEPAVEPLTLAEAKHHLRVDHQEGAMWAADTEYIKGDIVAGTDGNDYQCIEDHTSFTDDKPITGANYESY